jgi:hypothetical protein
MTLPHEDALARVQALADRWTQYGSPDLRNAARILRMKVLKPYQEQPGHTYLSTSCIHDEHSYCSSPEGGNDHGDTWTKQPSSCKFCSAPCVCDCHRESTPR